VPHERRFASVKSSGAQAAFFTLPSRMHRCTRGLLPHACHDRAQALRFGLQPAAPRVISRGLITFQHGGRFAAELTLHAIFSFLLKIYFGLRFSRSKSRNQLRILHPPPPAKYSFLSRRAFGRGVCALDGIAVVAVPDASASYAACVPASATHHRPVSFRTGSRSRCVLSNPFQSHCSYRVCRQKGVPCRP